MSADNFLAGFPRVIYGFVRGMLLHRLWTNPSTFPRLNWLSSGSRIRAPVLYGVFVAMMIFPYSGRGLYALLFITLLAPAAIVLGANATCDNKFALSASTFLGWLSYPIYCLHLPVLTAFLFLEKRDQLHLLHATDYRVIAMGVTLGLAALSAFVLDRFELQRKLTAILARPLARAPTPDAHRLSLRSRGPVDDEYQELSPAMRPSTRL